ncbi:MAG: hypothetical protein P4N60_03175 [Verrucomicrobiae bacterium]|nr:hypothetical protein [Verrucomicrobiae bacterium]
MQTSGEGIKVSSPARFRWSRLARLIAVTLAVIYVFSRFIPAAGMSDYAAGDALDNSWTMALHEGFVQHLQFGTDLVFTHGPWGFLAHGYHPQTHLLAVIIWSGLALVFLYGGRQLARELGGREFNVWTWLVLLAALATTPLGNDFDSRLVLFLMLPLLLHFFTKGTAPAKAALVVSLGCLSLVKFTGLVEAALVVTLISVDDVFRGRRFPWAAPLWVASLLVFWVLAWQRLAGFSAFVVHSWQVAAGYTEAMMLPGNAPSWSLWGFVAIAVALWLLAARGMWLKLGSWAVLPLAGVGAVLFVTFKLGYVRADIQQLNSAMALLVLAALLLPLAWRESQPLKVAAAILLVASGLFWVGIFQTWMKGNGLATQLAGTFRVSNLLAPVADASTGYSRTEYQKELAAIRAINPLPPLSGGVDLYSYGQAVLFAHGLSYQPRPVVQSYFAYTPALAQMNAAWLRSGRAASNVLFSVQPLDGRFPSLDDGLSWPELLTRYAINPATSQGRAYLLLQRKAMPRGYQLVPLTNMEAVFGGSVKVPPVSNAPVWVELEFKKTPAGKIISAAYKPPILVMTALFRNGPPGYYRIVPGMAAAGFLLSPVVKDTKSFAALFGSDWPARLAHWDMQSMVIAPGTVSRSSLCYEPTFQVRFYRLEFSE